MVKLNLRSLFSRRKPFLIYVIASCAALTITIVVQYFRHGLFGTDLLLGWDSPNYVWLAKNVNQFGALHMIQHWGFPRLYTQILSFSGYFIGSAVLVERILPFVFSFVLIFATSRFVLDMTGNVHVAGLNAILSAISLSTLRLFSDLHRNLMALSISFLVLVLVPKLNSEDSGFNRKYLVFIASFFVVASTHFETFFLLASALVLHGILVRDFRKSITRIFATIVPILILTPLLAGVGYFASFGAELPVGVPFSLSETGLWLGGSVVSLVFLVIGGAYLSHKAIRQKSELSQILLCWIIVVMCLFLAIEIGVLRLSHEVSFRLLLIMPVPTLLALSALALFDGLKHLKVWSRISSPTRSHSLVVPAHKIALILVAIMITNTALVTLCHLDAYLTPYVPGSVYWKIVEAGAFFRTNRLEVPVVLLYGESATWFGWLARSYIGIELGEHFAFYGQFDDLLRLSPTVSYSLQDPNLQVMEGRLSEMSYDELQGRFKAAWYHSSFVTSVDELESHPILIISPDLYDGAIPYYLKPYHTGQGIYVIPPNTIGSGNGTLYGPYIGMFKDGTYHEVRSEYLNIDPQDPSSVFVRVNASAGFESYDVVGLPDSWSFSRLEQGGDPSYPEENPKRLNGAPAFTGNDPAESLENWTWIWTNGTALADTLSKKEGFSSLRISGRTDSLGNLGSLYDAEGMWDLTTDRTIAMWAKSSEPASLVIDLHDSNGNVRTYWGVEAYGASCSTEWKRFAIDLDQYTSQSGEFNEGAVDRIFIKINPSGIPQKSITLWIDDLTVDKIEDFHTHVLKGRVLLDELVVFYFKQRDTD